METRVKDILTAPKFDRIVFYLNQQGVSTVEKLNDFDFNEFMFVPGISEAEVNDARDILEKYKLQKLVEATNPGVDSIKADCNAPQSNAAWHNVLIAETYRETPRSNSFIQYCTSIGKTLMSQLSEIDFQNASSLPGIGVTTIERLRSIWLDFLQNPSKFALELEIAEADPDITSVFGDLPHGGILIHYCKSKGWDRLSDLIDFSFDAAEVKGIGPATMEKFLQVYLKSIVANENQEKAVVRPAKIAEENLKLPIEILYQFGISESDLLVIKESGIFKIEDLCTIGISYSGYMQIRTAIQELETPVVDTFVSTLNALKDSAYQCLIRKAQGDTLQAIAVDLDLTRERVRQINVKSCAILSRSANLVAMSLRCAGNVCIEGEKLLALISNSEAATCCKYVLSENGDYQYIKSIDKFVPISEFNRNINEAMQQYVNDVIGDGLNFYDSLENIERQLSDYSLDFFDFEDVLKYVAANGYRFYGDYVIRGRGSYARVCYDAILKYFPFDIKLDGNEENKEVNRLRAIIEDKYDGLILPEKNRSLCARLATDLVLSDRGRYCPIEKIVYSVELLEDIFRFIQNSSQTTFYYTELFSCFQGRLLAETNITNSNFLHGVLKYLYPDDFLFERDLLVRSGEKRKGIDERLCDILLRFNKPISKKEILQAIPGLNDFVLTFAAARIPNVIQWEYGFYNHLNNLVIDAADVDKLQSIISDEMRRYHGYLSEAILFRRTSEEYPEFLQKNEMNSSQNLYYLCAYLYGEQYRFRRPHILTIDFPIKDFNIKNIARVLLGNKQTLNYFELMKLSEDLAWASGTFYGMFHDMEKDYIRISEDDYILKEVFCPSEDFLKSIKQQIGRYVDESGYFAVSAIINYDSFPACGMPWNGFLIQSIIEQYDLGYRIIEPQVKDRRVQKGIIVPSESPDKTFEDLVVFFLCRDSISAMSELEMRKYLSNLGIIRNNIPQELYECPRLQFKNDMFVLKG